MEVEIGERVIEQAYEFWIGPEIDRRRTAGELDDAFALVAAQVIFDMSADAPAVRLNEEVRAIARAKAARAVDEGPVFDEDIADYEDILLTDADQNAGHITVVAHRGGWVPRVRLSPQRSPYSRAP